MINRVTLKYFLKKAFIASFGISFVLFSMAKLSEFAFITISKYIYFPFAFFIMAFFMFYSLKILSKHPVLLFMLLLCSFYLLIGHGFIYSTWHLRESGKIITATSMSNLNQQIIENKDQKQTINYITPIPEFKIYKQYRGFYYYHRYVKETQVQRYIYAVPYASEEQFQNKNFPLWIICEKPKNINHKKHCFDDIDTSKGGAYLIDNNLELKAVKDSIISNELASIDAPLMLKWSAEPEKETRKALKFNKNSLKAIIASWFIISFLSFVASLFKKTNTS